MITLPPIRMTGGVYTTPMEAGPDDFVESMNLHNVNGVLQKRAGMTHVVSHGTRTTPANLYQGWGLADGTYPGPGAIDSAAYGALTGYAACDLYIGSATGKFARFYLYGKNSSALDNWTLYSNSWSTLDQCTVEYWNGSAWSAVPCADFFHPHDMGPTYGLSLAPFRGVKIDGTFVNFTDAPSPSPTPGFPITTGIIAGFIVPPSDWSTINIASGGAKYWLRIRSTGSNSWTGINFLEGCGILGSSSYVWFDEVGNLPILNQLYFNDIRGTRHSFVVYQKSDQLLGYVMDDYEMTPSDGLQPDGTSAMFSSTTKVWSYYDSSTDRIIGHVQGLGWFYALGTGNQEIYSLGADDVATLTGYENVAGGLRSVIPPGVVACTHDDRIFTANGSDIVYSSPWKYKDVWPNDNEIFAADDAGNVTAMASIGGVLTIFKRNSIWVAQSDGSADGYVAYRLPGAVGCMAPRSVAVAGNHCWFLAEDGIYTFDGQSVKKMSRRIDGLLNRGAASSNMARAIGVWSSVFNQYRLFYPGVDDPPWVCAQAIYCAVDTEGKVTFWPQGKNAAGDYGFQATTVANDNTADVNRIMLGDRYGNIWQMDQGLKDGPSNVTFYGLTHRIALGVSQKMLVRWVTPTTRVFNNQSWTCSTIINGDTLNKQTLVFSGAGDNPALAFYQSAANGTYAFQYTADGTYANSFDMETSPSGSIQGLGRFAQLEISDSVAQQWEAQAITLELNKSGRRG